MVRSTSGIVLCAALVASLSTACSGGDDGPGPADRAARVVYTEQRDPCASADPLRNLYFGDLHSHAAYSYDAWIWEGRLEPGEAYRFARGGEIRLPPLDATGQGTRRLRLDRPLDFAAVTDHAEFLGEVEACVKPDSPVYGALSCRLFRQSSDLSFILFGLPLALPEPRRLEDVCGAGGARCPALAAEVWSRVQAAAEAAYDRTSDCAFTTFVGYEYTGSAGGSTLHRNVIFRNDRVPTLPVSHFERPSPAGLREALREACLDGLPGCDVIAIPHNANMSNGNMFWVDPPPDEPVEEQRDEAAFRARMEPVVEIFQHKGDSECMNGLSGVLGPEDPLCDFEKLHPPPVEDCGETPGALGGSGRGCVSRMDFVRNVLLEGLREEERLGINPYRLGFTASTDTHNVSPGAVGEDAYAGHLGTLEDEVGERLGPFAITPTGIRNNPGGLTAVWAVENGRDAIFEALRRGEVYGTSGPRIAVRFFGGWEFPDDLCGSSRAVMHGYARGVPMGGPLPARPADVDGPTFYVRAIRDLDAPDATAAPLQRIQIVKGWITLDGQAMQRVFEVAGDPYNGARADTETCEAIGTGFDTLCTVWRDPSFHPDEPAFYYARAIENPTCRWSARECNQLSPESRPASCEDPAVPQVIQERAWTSPIWYGPEAR